MISVERFVARSSMREAWLVAREAGVTATQVAKASTPAGMKEVLAQIEQPVEVIPNAYMEWGNQREPYIADYIKSQFGILPNDWLIRADGAGNEWMMATPDGLDWHNDHKVIAEIKTTGKPLDKIPANYMRQVQWQMMVTGAERCLFAYELRLEGPEGFMPGFEIATQWVERDEKMISELIETAQKVQEHAVYFDRAKREGN